MARVQVVRLAAVLVMWPLLANTGYGLTWREGLVLVRPHMETAVGAINCQAAAQQASCGHCGPPTSACGMSDSKRIRRRCGRGSAGLWACR